MCVRPTLNAQGGDPYADGTTAPYPVRGTPGGWRDVWDDPDPALIARARLAEVDRQEREFTERDGLRWRQEIANTRRLVRAGR